MPVITCIHQDGRQYKAVVSPDGVSDWIAKREARGSRIEKIEFSATERAAVVLAGSDAAADPLVELALLRSDLAMARVLEDVIAILNDKGLLAEADLPEEARKKIADRHALRKANTEQRE